MGPAWKKFVVLPFGYGGAKPPAAGRFGRALFRRTTLGRGGDSVNMRTVMIAVLLAVLIAVAGCASPQDETETGGDPGQVESPTTADNDAGGEPVAPPNETNNESGATVEPEDGAGANESGADESGLNETTAEAGANESSANESVDVGEESYQVAPAAVQFAATGQTVLLG